MESGGTGFWNIYFQAKKAGKLNEQGTATMVEEFNRNEHGVPQYPRGHTGRLLVAAAAAATLERPTASSVANLTGLEKGNIDRMVLIELKSQFGVEVTKSGPVYQIEDWGRILKPAGVKGCLTVLVNRTTLEAIKK